MKNLIAVISALGFILLLTAFLLVCAQIVGFLKTGTWEPESLIMFRPLFQGLWEEWRGLHGLIVWTLDFIPMSLTLFMCGAWMAASGEILHDVADTQVNETK